ncbi:M1-specific T cell receptor alpha chain-like isoform X1 [Gambusia affinis]|uniref:M1-specific T cell receptor alpha chain-like isoform X1 n=1 Tax=Gambusia affinis TaxID=33528 RepID=UPI001CDB6ACF|nr:M1-specific T cell receptor alpha chain-like isoform X1 [Gambusia affinis]
MDNLDNLKECFCLTPSRCVTQTGFNKIQFGSGSKLSVEQKNEIEPDYYNLDYDGTRVCLATGFTRLNATMMTPGFQNQSASQITDHKGEPTGFYSQVAFQEDGEECENEKQGEGEITKPDQCDAELEPDEMVNLASITIFGLRIIFIKTVAFNVLMTLRLWTSQ